MSKGSYSDFLGALLDFESGWDRARYETGRIVDAQLDQWAGGRVQDFFPNYGSWGDLNDAEWNAMAYRSMNSLGFVGFQFGEALLIDLGYYEDDQFYGNGAATNTWDGTWTGKNGVNSLQDFMTAEAQNRAIQEAFGYNLQVIQTGLGYQGESLADYIGTTRTFMENGQEVSVELTLTGIMAAAHLRGAWGTLALLQASDVSTDEYGTSILRYIRQFGDYEAPSVDAAIAIYDGADPLPVRTGPSGGEPVTTPETPINEPEEPTTPTPAPMPMPMPGHGADAFNNPTITEANATVAINWQWGRSERIVFDAAKDTLFISWISRDNLTVEDTPEGLRLSVPTNNQSVTLLGVKAADLDPVRINILDASTRALFDTLVPSTGGHGGMTGTMYQLDLDSPSRTIDPFEPEADMVHMGAGITDARLSIFEESGEALGQTVRIVVSDEGGAILSTTILVGVGLADLSMANFSIAEQSAQNKIAAALGDVIETPVTGGGFEIPYDSDGANPATTLGSTANGGTVWRADFNADDITSFDPARDVISVGNTSVHGMIVTKSTAGEIVIDSPWSDAAQILRGTSFSDLNIDSFGIVGNEHMRQDIGGVLSWELGLGPRDADTIYVRSHEYGRHEVIDDFDPATMKISFLYFGTRERLSVEDTDAGLTISSLPSGQSVTLTGVTLSDLVAGQVEFHHDQVMEDNLEVPFGFSQDDVTLVSRAGLVTPTAPTGESTDGFQVRQGDFGPAQTPAPDPDTPPDPSPLPIPTPLPTPTPEPVTPPDTLSDGAIVFGTGQDSAEIFWNWAAKTVVNGFDPDEDMIDFRSLQSANLRVSEQGDDLVIEVLGNGGNTTTLLGIQAEDLTLANITADPWNNIAKPDSDLLMQLNDLGLEL